MRPLLMFRLPTSWMPSSILKPLVNLMDAHASCQTGRHALALIRVVAHQTLWGMGQTSHEHRRQGHGLTIRCACSLRTLTLVLPSRRQWHPRRHHQGPHHSQGHRRHPHPQRRHHRLALAVAGAALAARCTVARLQRVGARSRPGIVLPHAVGFGAQPGQLQFRTRSIEITGSPSEPRRCSLQVILRVWP